MYRQIQDQILYGIASGQLRPGEQLLTVRALAVELEINPNTVIKAYSELERDGVLTSEQGSGTFVAPSPPAKLGAGEKAEKLRAIAVEFIAEAARYGFTTVDVLGAMIKLVEEEKP
jgi:DNA-binding transcriptional regulator YhcF (GntR family)